jgi:hypothetical protein
VRVGQQPCPAMSTSARKRLMRDFKRLQVRHGSSVQRAAYGANGAPPVLCAACTSAAARFLADDPPCVPRARPAPPRGPRRRSRRQASAARRRSPTSCSGKLSFSDQRTRRGKGVRNATRWRSAAAPRAHQLRVRGALAVRRTLVGAQAGTACAPTLGSGGVLDRRARRLAAASPQARSS